MTTARTRSSRSQATEVRIQGPDGKFTLVKARQGVDARRAGRATAPIPKSCKPLLAGLPDFWAERFVDKKGKNARRLRPRQAGVHAHGHAPGGAAVKVLVGKVSDTKERIVTRPGPPNQFGMPPKPIVQIVKEEYRFAKLEDNDQIFEVKSRQAQGRRRQARRAARPPARPLQDRRRPPARDPQGQGDASSSSRTRTNGSSSSRRRSTPRPSRSRSCSTSSPASRPAATTSATTPTPKRSASTNPPRS